MSNIMLAAKKLRNEKQKIHTDKSGSLSVSPTSSENCHLKRFQSKVLRIYSLSEQQNAVNIVDRVFSSFSHKSESDHYFWSILTKATGEHSKDLKNITFFFLYISKHRLSGSKLEFLKVMTKICSVQIYLLSNFSKCLKHHIHHKINKRSVLKNYEASLELFNLRDDIVDDIINSPPVTNKISSLEKRNHSEQSPDLFKNSIKKIIAENGHLVLNCPEITIESEVEWYKFNNKLNSSFRHNMAESEKEPHLTIDSYNVLYILQATKEEEGNYTCYIDGKPFQTYFVKVVSKSKLLNQEFFRYSLYLGFVLSLTITCYCAGICVAWHQRGYFADPLYLSLNSK